MKVEVLVAAVNEDVRTLAEKMNLETEAVIVNQCDHYDYTEYEHNDRRIRCFSMAERGVGLSRNTSLLRACEDILLFGDEDVMLEHGYEQRILDAFSRNPDADVIAFNVKVDPRRKTYYNTKNHRIRFYNYGRYPAYAIAAKRKSLHGAGVTFSLLFGGGAKYSNGEDSLFLHDCLKKGLHLYADTTEIGEEIYRESTWFNGYTEKFFRDRGVLYHFLYGRLALVWTWRFLLAKKKVMCSETGVKQAYKWMKSGIREGKYYRKGTDN